MQIGDKYQETLMLKTVGIAALVRRELRAAQKARGFRCKVTSEYFSMGSAIRVKLEFPEDCDHVAAALTVRWAQLVLNQYNRQDIDFQTDHFSVRFYGSVHHNLGRLSCLDDPDQESEE